NTYPQAHVGTAYDSLSIVESLCHRLCPPYKNHNAQLSSATFCPLSTCRKARSLIVTPISRSSSARYSFCTSPDIALLRASRRRLLSSDAKSVVGGTTSVTRNTSCSPG